MACRRLSAYPIDADSQCFEDAEALPDVCVVETAPETTSGLAVHACLVSPQGQAFWLPAYSHTHDLQGEGWTLYVDDALQASWNEFERSAAEQPPECDSAAMWLQGEPLTPLEQPQPLCAELIDHDPCRALDAHSAADDCATPFGFAWNGTDCEALWCDCVGSECNLLSDSADHCQTSWLGCSNAVPVCEGVGTLYEEGDPGYGVSQPLVRFAAIGEDNEGWPGPDLETWTPVGSVNLEPLETPPSDCTPAPGQGVTSCPTSRRVNLGDVQGQPAQLDLWLHWDDIDEASLFQAESYDAILTRRLFALREAATQRVVLAVSSDLDQSGPTWSAPPFEIAAADARCMFPPQSICNWVFVASRVQLSLTDPARTFAGDLGNAPRFAPWSRSSVSIVSAADAANYQLFFDVLFDGQSETPLIQPCAAQIPSRAGFALVLDRSSLR